MSGLVVSNLLLWIVVAIQTVMLVAVLRHLGTNLLQSRTRLSPGPPIGTRLRELNVHNLLGQSISLATPDSSVRNAFFLATWCPTCAHVLRTWDELRGMANDDVAVFIVHGTEDSVAMLASENGLDKRLVVADPDGSIGDVWSVINRPFVVVLDQTGVVVDSGIPESRDQLRAILRIAPEATVGAVEETTIAVPRR